MAVSADATNIQGMLLLCGNVMLDHGCCLPGDPPCCPDVVLDIPACYCSEGHFAHNKSSMLMTRALLLPKAHEICSITELHNIKW